MSKAINWPIELKDEITSEEFDSQKIALRLGTLYYDKNYYHVNDIVDLRVSHNILRKALINEPVFVTTIEKLSEDMIKKYKKNLNSHAVIADFLSKTYKQPVTLKTQITVIPYTNKDFHQE